MLLTWGIDISTLLTCMEMKNKLVMAFERKLQKVLLNARTFSWLQRCEQFLFFLTIIGYSLPNKDNDFRLEMLQMYVCMYSCGTLTMNRIKWSLLVAIRAKN